jgi:hypothetical protein
MSTVPSDSLLKGKSFRLIYTLEGRMGVVSRIPEMDSKHLSYCADTKYLAF